MRRVKFISGLKVEIVTLATGQNLFEYGEPRIRPNCVPVSDPYDSYLLTDTVERHIIPVHHIRHFGDDDEINTIGDLYIAYTKDVQELLQMPFDVMSQQLAEAEGECRRLNYELFSTLDKVKHASVLKRLRYLFTGKL